MNTKETTYVVSVLHIGVRDLEGSVFSCELSGTGETTYVVSVLHIGVHYIDVSMQKGQCLAVS